MEDALIEMKKRNDELVRGNKDAIDGPTSPKFYTTNDQVLHLQEELKRREAAHTERIVEMVSIEFIVRHFQPYCPAFSPIHLSLFVTYKH